MAQEFHSKIYAQHIFVHQKIYSRLMLTCLTHYPNTIWFSFLTKDSPQAWTTRRLYPGISSLGFLGKMPRLLWKSGEAYGPYIKITFVNAHSKMPSITKKKIYWSRVLSTIPLALRFGSLYLFLWLLSMYGKWYWFPFTVMTYSVCLKVIKRGEMN